VNVVGPNPGEELRALMNDETQREVECQPYLQYAHLLLVPPMSRVIQVVREQVAMAGRSDYFLVCEVSEVDVRRRLILWEAKAPQLAPFEVSTQNRLIPSRALVEAENQLLYYFDEYRSNGQFLDRYQIRHADDVRLGGIVIGREDNWVRPPRDNAMPQEVLRQLASSALRIRDEHFYRGRIRILTWDHVASVMSLGPVVQQAAA
jgi:hypothetical protein